MKQPIPNAHIDTILRQVATLNLNTGILLIGFDGKEAQITEINDRDVTDFRDMNFHAIGSGNIQAANTLLFQKHDKKDELKATIYNVYKAKRNAEVLQGVGKETELLILNTSKCIKISKQDMDTLEKIYLEELKFGKENSLLNDLNLNGVNCVCEK